MKKITLQIKKYQIASWLIPTAFAMIILTSLTISHTQASDTVVLSRRQTANQQINATDLINLTNDERIKNQLSPLSTNALLIQAAQTKALDLRVNNYFDHYRPTDSKTPWDFIDETGYRWRVAGENLARGFENNDQIVQAWMNSASHRANILNPKYTEIGIATVESTKDGLPIVIAVQLFGAPLR